MDFLAYQIRAELSREFNRFAEIWGEELQENIYAVRQFQQMLSLLEDCDLAPKYMTTAFADLTCVIHERNNIPPLLIIDEYHQQL